eukprot:4995733-Pleurochrysis_carterae.AAC.1
MRVQSQETCTFPARSSTKSGLHVLPSALSLLRASVNKFDGRPTRDNRQNEQVRVQQNEYKYVCCSIQDQLSMPLKAILTAPRYAKAHVTTQNRLKPIYRCPKLVPGRDAISLMARDKYAARQALRNRSTYYTAQAFHAFIREAEEYESSFCTATYNPVGTAHNNCSNEQHKCLSHIVVTYVYTSTSTLQLACISRKENHQRETVSGASRFVERQSARQSG